MQNYPEWKYTIVKDEFSLYFPEGDYNIESLMKWYKIIPTNGEKIAYYDNDIELLKQHFEKFLTSDDIHTRVINDLHSNPILYIRCMTIYDTQDNLMGFAAQENKDGFKSEKKILYFGELSEMV